MNRQSRSCFFFFFFFFAAMTIHDTTKRRRESTGTRHRLSKSNKRNQASTFCVLRSFLPSTCNSLGTAYTYRIDLERYCDFQLGLCDLARKRNKTRGSERGRHAVNTRGASIRSRLSAYGTQQSAAADVTTLS